MRKQIIASPIQAVKYTVSDAVLLAYFPKASIFDFANALDIRDGCWSDSTVGRSREECTITWRKVSGILFGWPHTQRSSAVFHVYPTINGLFLHYLLCAVFIIHSYKLYQVCGDEGMSGSDFCYAMTSKHFYCSLLEQYKYEKHYGSSLLPLPFNLLSTCHTYSLSLVNFNNLFIYLFFDCWRMGWRFSCYTRRSSYKKREVTRCTRESRIAIAQ